MNDKELIQGIINKDEKYFKIFVDKYQSLVLNVCTSFLHCKSDAEDLTQEIFVEVFLSIHKFRNEAKLSTWLYRMAVNRSLNFIRNNKKRNIIKNIGSFFTGDDKKEIQIADPSYLYEDSDDVENERIELLHKAIDSLPEKQKIAFTLSKFDKLSYAEISEIMGITLAAVEGLIHRAKKNVAKKILSHYRKTSKKGKRKH
ncbi:MAG: RNA polymerase sigma factor [Chlorobi bacterium]|nr:RNA polymerase sigma factor [Chlorobiota bacterium]